MKILLPVLALVTVLATGRAQAQQTPAPAGSPDVIVIKGEGTASATPAPTPGMSALPHLPAGMKGSFETSEATIEKIYTAERDGFRAQAFVVQWHDQEVVVSSPLGASDKQVGDKLTFMAQELEMPMMGQTMKTLQFTATDPDLLKKMMAGMKASPSASPTATSAPAQ